MKNIKYLINNELKTTNNSNLDLEIKEELGKRNIITITALNDLTLKSAEIKDILELCSDDLFFLNGYQSWTDTKECTLNDIERNVLKVPGIIRKTFVLEAYGDRFIYDYNKNKLHGFDVFYIKGKNECFSLNHNYENAYLIYDIDKIEKTLSLISDVDGVFVKKGESFTIFDYTFYDSIEEGLNDFHSLFPKKDTPKLFGYSSWYNYYQNINEEIILKDLECLDDRFNLVQIDDGYQEFVGDWMHINKNKFPNGLKGIVDEIHARGKKAGIWVAPFAAETKSEVFNTHPEYFKKVNDKFVKTGCNWSGFYTYDLENEDAKNHIKKNLEYLMDLGFDFFKLDFLYASSFVRYEGKSRAMVARWSYQFLHDILKDKLILGCGAVVSSSANLFEYLRIGPDVSLEFDDKWFMRKLHRERISTKVTLQNTIYRSLFNYYMFNNDPDVFLLRDENISLSKKQKEALTIINSLFGGVLMTSDNISSYDGREKELLEESFELFYQARNQKFVRDGDLIKISYTLNDNEHHFVYDTIKGEIING